MKYPKKPKIKLKIIKEDLGYTAMGVNGKIEGL